VRAVIAVRTGRARGLTGHTADRPVLSRVTDERTGVSAGAAALRTGGAYVEVLVRTALTVVVDVVTQLHVSRVHRGVAVIAVTGLGGVVVARRGTQTLAAAVAPTIAVTVVVVGRAATRILFVRQAVTVVVEAVALLALTRVRVRVAVVAIRRCVRIRCVRVRSCTQTLAVPSHTVTVRIHILEEGVTRLGVLFVEGTIAVLIVGRIRIANLSAVSHLAHAGTKATAAASLRTRVAVTDIQRPRRACVTGLTVGVVRVLTTARRHAGVRRTYIAVVTILRTRIRTGTPAITEVRRVEGQTVAKAGATDPVAGTVGPGIGGAPRVAVQTRGVARVVRVGIARRVITIAVARTRTTR